MTWTPQTPEHWRQLATLADAMLDLHVLASQRLLPDCRIPTIDADHCRHVLATARDHGIVPRAADVNTVTAQLLRQFRQ